MFTYQDHATIRAGRLRQLPVHELRRRQRACWGLYNLAVCRVRVLAPCCGKHPLLVPWALAGMLTRIVLVPLSCLTAEHTSLCNRHDLGLLNGKGSVSFSALLTCGVYSSHDDFASRFRPSQAIWFRVAHAHWVCGGRTKPDSRRGGSSCWTFGPRRVVH